MHFLFFADFFGALRARVYDDEVRKWIAGVGIETIGKKLVNSKEGPPTFDQPKMTLEKLLEYGNMLVQEQENVKRVQLADKYLEGAALGDANQDAIKSGSYYGLIFYLLALSQFITYIIKQNDFDNQ
jgi:hypothetical protein